MNGYEIVFLLPSNKATLIAVLTHGISHPYQLDEYISNLGLLISTFQFYLHF